MREIKFRLWTGSKMILSENASEEDFYLTADGEIKYTEESNTNWSSHTSLKYRDNNCILMQFIGIRDKNNTEVFEGDIARILYSDWPSQPQDDTKTLEEYMISISNIGYIGQSEYGWEIFLRNKYNEIFGESLNPGQHGFIVVIGNIYEHPHLLPEETLKTE